MHLMLNINCKLCRYITLQCDLKCSILSGYAELGIFRHLWLIILPLSFPSKIISFMLDGCTVVNIGEGNLALRRLAAISCRKWAA